MADLRSALEAAGCTDVATYIQSGNAVIDLPAGTATDPAAWLERVISEAAGFDVPVIVRTADQLRDVATGMEAGHAVASGWPCFLGKTRDLPRVGPPVVVPGWAVCLACREDTSGTGPTRVVHRKGSQ